MPSTPLAAHLPPSPAAGAAPVMRLITVPDAAPPYDCDTHGADCQPAHAARKRTGGRGRSPLKTTNVRPPAPREMPSGPQGASPAKQEASPAAMTAGWPGQFAQVIVEILGGSRPPRQLIPLTTARARSQISQLASFVAADQRPKVKRVMVSRPTERVMEMTMVVCFGVRSRALAMRLEHCAGRPAAPGLPARPARWICTEAETG